MPNIILSCPNRTDAHVRSNWIYNLNVGADARPMPMDILENVTTDGAIGDEFDHRERDSPIHESPLHHSHHPPHILDSRLHNTRHFSNHFIGASFRVIGAMLDDILSKMHAQNAIDAERDNLTYAMHQHQIDIMYHVNQMQTQKTTMMEQMGHAHAFRAYMVDNMHVIQASHASFLVRVRHTRAS